MRASQKDSRLFKRANSENQHAPKSLGSKKQKMHSPNKVLFADSSNLPQKNMDLVSTHSARSLTDDDLLLNLATRHYQKV